MLEVIWHLSLCPKKPLNLLRNAIGSSDIEVLIEHTENNALFTFNDISLMCRLIEGKYPSYEAVIPKENPNKLTIDRLDLFNSIRRVSIFANKTTHQVRLKMNGSELNVSAEDLDFANEAQERLPAPMQARIWRLALIHVSSRTCCPI
jgi:DNA polymerase-3 subunit beta